MYQTTQNQQYQQQQQSIKRMSTKELNYLSDNMKNEDLLAKLCVQGAVECQNTQLRNAFESMAQEHVQSYQQLLSTLQQQG
jgi:hypothetical protein